METVQKLIGCKTMHRFVAAMLLCFIGFSGCASEPTKQDFDASIRAANSVLARFENDPAASALHGKLKAAKAILIVSAGLDRGVALARADSSQTWSTPAIYRVTHLMAAGRAMGGSGFTAGKPNLDLIVLAMTDKALNWMKSPKLPGQDDMVVMAMTGDSGEREYGKADMLLFSKEDAVRSQRFFGEIFVSVDKVANQSLYGKPLSLAEIFSIKSAPNSDAASLQKTVVTATQ
jgi:lipid-binding SYLF domain-containing protein